MPAQATPPNRVSKLLYLLQSHCISRTFKEVPMMVLLTEIVIFGALFAGMWKVFEKAGRPGWEAIVPIYNLYILTTKIVGRSPIWFVACLIPLLGLVPAALLCIDVAKSFG